MMPRKSSSPRRRISQLPLLAHILISFLLKPCSGGEWALHSYQGGAVATSFYLDEHRNEILSTGAAYANQFGVFEDGGPRCLLGTMEMGRLGRYRRDAMRISHRRALPEPQFCTSAVVLNDPGDAVLIGWHPSNEIGESVTNLDEMLVEVDYYGETLDPKLVTTIQKTGNANKPIQVPVHAVHDPASDDIIVALMQTSALPESISTQSKEDPLSFILNLQDSLTGGIHPWALPENRNHDNWEPIIQRISKTGQVKWTPSLKENNYITHITRIAVDGETIWAVGYRQSSITSNQQHWDGMLYKLDLQTGAIQSVNVISSSNTNDPSQQHHNDHLKCITVQGNYLYITGSTESTVQKTQEHESFGLNQNGGEWGDFSFGGEKLVNDVITPAPTAQTVNDSSSAPSPAPVGNDRRRNVQQRQATTGENPNQKRKLVEFDESAFVMQIDKTTLRTEWVEHIEGAEGNVCASSNDFVYVGGSVSESVHLENPQEVKFGGLDAFLAQYDFNGVKRWVKRIGTNKDEYLVDMLVDGTGKPIVAGNQQTRINGRNDVFYFSFSIQNGDFSPQWTQPEVSNNVPQTNVTPKNNYSSRPIADNQAAVVAFATVVPIVLLLIVGAYMWNRGRRDQQNIVDEAVLAEDLQQTPPQSSAASLDPQHHEEQEARTTV